MRVTVLASSVPAEFMGGAEYQAYLVAQGLADLGHDVVFIATDTAEDRRLAMYDVLVHKVPGSGSVGQARHEQLVLEAIRDSAPDLCYVRVFPELRTVVPACKQSGIPVVSITTHLLETSPFLLGYGLKRAIQFLLASVATRHVRSFLSIRHCAAHVCIAKSLQQRIQRWYPRKDLRTIYNGVPVPPPEEMHHGSSGQVIWVNNLKHWKRPEVYVELARRLPQFRFLMIGRMAEGGRYAERLRQWMQQASSNFQYLGPKPIDQVNGLIRQSDLLLYTSTLAEGFGNSFIQAWLRGVPTVSLTFDPDGILERERVGRCSKTFEELVSDVRDLLEDDAARQEMGCRAREYAASHHSVEKLATEYETLFQGIVAGDQVRTPTEGGQDRGEVMEERWVATDHG